MDFNPKDQKIVPQAVEAEKSVLGCMLLDKDATLKIADFLEPQDFYHDHHRFIYEICLDLFHRAEPIDVVTVATRLEAKKKLKTIGGPEYLAELQNTVPVTTHIFQYAQLIKHRSTLRKLITAGNKITGLGYESEKKMEELLEKAEKELFSISQTFSKIGSFPSRKFSTIVTNALVKFMKTRTWLTSIGSQPTSKSSTASSTGALTDPT